ncbi:MAG: MotA/TolQ/ExbB proton channel family protein [Phycisphaeraceae bacterium]|nr:MotA/TolQ/ExbB proton channel family protein [Phycisphaeraceae bacterium]
MDLGVLFGFLGTWVVITWALLSGGSLLYYVDVPSIILVCGATFTIVFYAFPARNVKRVMSVAKRLFFYQGQSIEKLIEDMVSFAEIARRDGILSLENALKDIDDPFIVTGIQMAVDGTDPELIEQIMLNELENLENRHAVGKAMFDCMGKYAPAYGMIGTLVGLVIMLQNMDDPSKIGPGMAVALLTTMYGAIIANAFALPMSDRLALRSGEEVLYKTIIIKGVMAIQSGDNPRIVEQKLRTFLPPSMRKAAEEEAA